MKISIEKKRVAEQFHILFISSCILTIFAYIILLRNEIILEHLNLIDFYKKEEMHLLKCLNEFIDARSVQSSKFHVKFWSPEWLHGKNESERSIKFINWIKNSLSKTLELCGKCRMKSITSEKKLKDITVITKTFNREEQCELKKDSRRNARNFAFRSMGYF